MPKKVLVTGASGFIGSHLVKRLKEEGNYVIAADIKSPHFQKCVADMFKQEDLRDWDGCKYVMEGVEEVYHLAANMGGIGYIGTCRFDIATGNARMDSMILQAAVRAKVKKLFFSSSACVYPVDIQTYDHEVKLGESDAWPADPERGYGLEKLFMEELCSYAKEETSLETYVGRFHTIYGPYGTWDGGREKFPAAVCRKVIQAKDGGEIELWGNGKQRRSFLYVDDCIDGIIALVESGYQHPVNIGSEESITVEEAARMVMEIAGKKLTIRNDLDKPIGVQSRNSDSTKIKEVTYDWKTGHGWEPKVPFRIGIQKTYEWIKDEIDKSVVR